MAKEDLDHVNAELLRTNEYLDEQVKQRTLHLEQTMEELDRFLYSSFHCTQEICTCQVSPCQPWKNMVYLFLGGLSYEVLL